MAFSALALAVLIASAQVVSLDVRDMDLSDFLRFMANTANLNLVLHPAVQGKVNVMVKDAPWEEVLDVVLRNYGLGRAIEGKTLRIAPVATPSLQEKQGVTPALPGQAAPQSRVFFLKYARAEDIAVVISRLVSPQGSVVAYPPLNAVIVTDVAPPKQ
jgi:type IV pilus assembly protein PilQ